MGRVVHKRQTLPVPDFGAFDNVPLSFSWTQPDSLEAWTEPVESSFSVDAATGSWTTLAPLGSLEDEQNEALRSTFTMQHYPCEAGPTTADDRVPYMSIGAGLKVPPVPECFVWTNGQPKDADKSQSNQSVSQKPVHASELARNPEFESEEDRRIVTCPYAGCSYQNQGRYHRRKWDLQRHIDSRHLKKKACVCPARGCFKKQAQSSFARADKLIAHFRAMHREDTIVQCPNDNCCGNFMPADLLPVHMRLAHIYYPRRLRGFGFNQLDKDLWTKRKCPIGTCRMRLKYWDVIIHLEAHSASELKLHTEDLTGKNLKLVKEPASANEFNKVVISCPVCATICRDCKAFEMHMIEAHLIVWTSDALTRWKAEVAKYPVWYAHSGLNRGDFEHRDDLSDLVPLRRQILRHYPDFANVKYWAPVWEDLAKPVRRQEASSKESDTTL